MSAVMSPAEALTALKAIAQETEDTLIPPCAMGCADCPGAQPVSLRSLSDQRLTEMLVMHDYNVKAAAYQALLEKSKITDIKLPSGMALPDQSAYFLRLASYYRPNHTRPLTRADEQEDAE